MGKAWRMNQFGLEQWKLSLHRAYTMAVSKQCNENFGFFKTKQNTEIGMCFRFNPQCGIGCGFRLSTAGDCDLPRALAEV